MSYIHVKDEDQAARLASDLSGTPRFALDCEAAGFHRYTDRLCLMQVTTPRATYVVDPLTVDCAALFRGPLTDPGVEIVMHGSDYDLRLLDRDLDIRLKGLFDTQIAAALLGVNGLGLAALLESRLGISLAKKYQRADWAKRPLPDDMLDYAANDTRYLLELGDIMRGELEKAGRVAWAEEEARALEISATTPSDDEEPEDPVTRVKGARDLPPRQIHALREALAWRDEIAREKDRAPFRVAGDKPLIDVAMEPPEGPRELADVRGFPKGLAREQGQELLERIRRAYQLDPKDLVGYPKPKRTGRGRPPPEVDAMVDRLRAVRTVKAGELGIDRGSLISNAVLQEIAWEDPGDETALRRVPGIRDWQVEVLGADILDTLLRHG
ncbi:MAG: HRDC domain-containing protein [Longimicrobiales bacterium]